MNCRRQATAPLYPFSLSSAHRSQQTADTSLFGQHYDAYHQPALAAYISCRLDGHVEDSLTTTKKKKGACGGHVIRRTDNRWTINVTEWQPRNCTRSKTPFLPHPDNAVSGVPIPNCSSLKLLGVTLYPKLTFELHLRSLPSSVSRKVGLLRKCSRIYFSDDVVKN